MLEFVDIQAWVIDQIQNNDIFAGIIGGSFAVSALFYLRSVPNLIWRFLQLQFSVHVVVHNSDEIFYHLENWLGAHPSFKKTRRLRLTSRLADDGGKLEMASSKKRERSNYNTGPGEGWHWFFFGKRLIIFRRDNDDKVNLQTMQVKETFEFYILGRSRKAFDRLVATAYESSVIEDSLRMYSWDNGYWAWLKDRQGRKLESIVLPKEQLKRIVSDVKWFCENEEWFIKRAIPYHRGYLFSGPPGTGKTSLAAALASYLDRDVYVINLNSIEKDDSLINAFNNVSKNCILLLEDIDSLPTVHQRTDDDGEEEKSRKGVTLSGLLNSLDGIATPQDCIIIMTTNYPEKLDKAILRKGRIDIHECIEPLEAYLVEEMYEKFTGNGDNARRLTYDLCEPMPAAELQGLLMEHGDNPYAIIKHAPQYFEENALNNQEVA